MPRGACSASRCQVKGPSPLLRPSGAKSKGRSGTKCPSAPHIFLERYRKHCYGEMGRHTGLRGLGPAGRLGSNPSSNNFLHILFPKHRYAMPIRLGRRSVFLAYLDEGLSTDNSGLFSSIGPSIRFIRGRLLVQI